MKKFIGYTLLSLLVLTLILGFVGIKKFNNKYFKETPAYVEIAHQSELLSFKWSNQKIDNYIEKQVAMLIPVQIGDLEHNLNMQFDTGAPDSFLYENDLQSLRKLGYEINEVEKDGLRFVESLELLLGGKAVTLSMVRVYPNYGNSFTKKSKKNVNYVIGTLGSDVLVDRITTIDFKNKTLQFFEERPDWMNDYSGFKSFDFPGRRVMLPVVVDGKDYDFLYDSGCSAFGLITTKNRFEKYTKDSEPLIAYAAKSWQDKIHINSKMSEYPFSIGGADLTLKRVSYVNMYSFLQPLVTPFTRIGGWMGNQALNQSKLILDTKTKTFIVIPG